ncbi:MAG: DUF5667 domain-containing protein [Anaerolineales bacterium]|jgi:hypothetical protein
MNRELDRLVDECFTRMQTDGWSVEQCLDAYPQYREVLKPLLLMGTALQSHLSPAPPASQFARNSRIRIENQMRSRMSAKRRRLTPSPSRQVRWYLRPAYMLASLTLVIALLASGFGVVNASAASLPGDALYGVKLAREQLALTLSLTEEGDQDLLAEFAEERLEEAEALIEENRLEDLPTALQGFEHRMDELEGLTNENEDFEPGSLEHLQSRLENHIQVLQGVLDNAPEQAREALQNALEKSSHAREVLESVHGEGNPSENAPGQNKPDEGKHDGEGEPQPGNSGQERGPKPKEEKEKGPPPWANND